MENKTENTNLKPLEIGKRYRLVGVIQNGWRDGKPNYTNEDVVRVVTRITDDMVITECGRKFLLEGLEWQEWISFSYSFRV